MVTHVIIVTGSIRARPDTVEQIEALSLAHVRRSREEPGCVLHSVHRDVEDGRRFVFLEHWVDAESLRAHFQLAASAAFVAEVAALADANPTIEIYQATATSV
ncbi:MAG: putative quinol monooxygenase [Acidimicrobiales bacterium]